MDPAAPTLVIMAAGMSSRFGSLKQLEPIGPDGQALLDYSVRDAARAGFGRVVFVARRAIETQFRAAIAGRYESLQQRGFGVDVVFQELADLPAGCACPSGRTKPWGTVQAVLAARHEVRSGAFAVLNADDFYGEPAFHAAAALCRSATTSASHAGLIAYPVARTLSEHGAVTRAVCELDARGCLVDITERFHIERRGDAGAVFFRDDAPEGKDGAWLPLDAATPVSMNFWCFHSDAFALLEEEFSLFLRSPRAADLGAELPLPTAVKGLLARSRLTVHVRLADSTWFGLTYQRDRDVVSRRLEELPRSAVPLAFARLFGAAKPLVVRSPGRINLIGEHTDYNGGFVVPAAIDREMVFALAPNDEARWRFHAYDMDASWECAAGTLAKPTVAWASYLVGVLAQFHKASRMPGGFDCVFGGTIPQGAGLSSSAALEVGLAWAVNRLFAYGLSELELVKMAQCAEHEYAGVKCGIMDQFVSMFGRQDRALRLDCRSLEYELFPVPLADHGVSIVLCDTQVKHTLASSAYNERREQCEAGVALLRQHEPSVASLRDVTPALLDAHRAEFADAVVLRRCSFVVAENARALAACAALAAGDVATVGRLLFEAHAGLRDDYAVSCDELDFLEAWAREHTGGQVLGARMMGGGFGGCTLNLVRTAYVEQFREGVTAAYRERFGRAPRLIAVRLADGAGLVQ